MRTTPKKTDRKAKKSYTLSPESVAFLETLRKRRRAASISSVLEEILQAVRRQQERARNRKVGVRVLLFSFRPRSAGASPMGRVCTGRISERTLSVLSQKIPAAR